MSNNPEEVPTENSKLPETICLQEAQVMDRIRAWSIAMSKLGLNEDERAAITVWAGKGHAFSLVFTQSYGSIHPWFDVEAKEDNPFFTGKKTLYKVYRTIWFYAAVEHLPKLYQSIKRQLESHNEKLSNILTELPAPPPL